MHATLTAWRSQPCPLPESCKTASVYFPASSCSDGAASPCKQMD